MLFTEAIYKSHLYFEVSSLTLEDEDGTNMLSLNVSKQLKTYAAFHPRRPTVPHLEILLFIFRNCRAQATCRCTRTRTINNDDDDDGGGGDDDDDDHSNNTD